MSASNGDIPVALCLEELYVNSANAKLRSHSFRLSVAYARRNVWTVLLAFSARTSVWGWKTVENRSFVPSNFIKVVQNVPVKRVSRSDTIDVGKPRFLT